MTSTGRGGESLSLDGGMLGRLEFNWQGDRYQHRWLFEDEVLITSLESDGTIVWPESPPLQQIHHQSFGDGREVLFGVGMSGRGHWSASFTLVPELRCWIVELACRIPGDSGELQSTYQLSESWSAADSRCHATKGEQGLVLEAISPSSSGEFMDGKFCIRPVPNIHDTTTIQWAFRLRA